MKRSNLSLLTAAALPTLSLLLVPGSQDAMADESDDRVIHLLSESAMLTGLPPQALYPFIDSTPYRIRRAHIAITDSTANCAGPGASAPDHVQILVGEAGGTLVPVMTEATNTGISNRPGQCVFHATVRAGAEAIPAKVTDIVVVNVGDTRLTSINTITVSAEVVGRD